MKNVQYRRLCLSLIVFGIIVVFCAPLVIATDVVSLPIIGEREIPEDFDFSVSNTQTEHTYYDQAVAQEDGTVAIYTRFTENSQNAFSRVYIDLYNPNGDFWKEVSFSSQFGVSIELQNNTLYLYFYDYMVTYDLITESLTCFETEPNFLRNSGRYNELHTNRFTCGEWEYRCQKSFWGYSKLTRTNGIQTQVLASFPGMGGTFTKTLVSVFGTFSLIFALYIFVNKRRKRGQRDDSLGA